MSNHILQSMEYKLIEGFYGAEKAKRSQAPLINHIHEGLKILELIESSEFAKKAYCLHPILQSDQNLKQNWEANFAGVSPRVMLLCMEYRKVANAYLSDRYIKDLSEINLSPVFSVNQMLIADKVQNYKDFLKYHSKSHPRAEELNQYFSNWLQKLGIKKQEFEELCTKIEN